MAFGKLEVLFLIGVAVFVMTWEFGSNLDVYYDMHSKLHKHEKVVPMVLLNPLASFASIKVNKEEATSQKKGKDEDEDDGSPVREMDGAEEMPLGEDEDEEPPMESSSSDSDEPSEEVIEQLEASMKAAAEEARKMRLEDTIMVVKLDEMRKSMEKGLLPADTKFSFHVSVPPSLLTSKSSFDEEESDFASKLEEKIQSWMDSLTQLEHAASGQSEPDDDPVWNNKVLIDDQEEWITREMARLRAEIRAEEHTSLSGKVVHPKDFYDEILEGNHGISSGVKGRSKLSAGSSQIKIVAHGAVAEYTDMIVALEKEISWWAHTSTKSLLVFGNSAYVHRDINTYSIAFKSAGFDVVKHKRDGPLSTKFITALEAPVLICLALKNDDCFSTVGQSKMKRYQRINRITGLRAVLWSKDSFCKTLSRGTKGEPMFADYVFLCWIFPLEYASAKEYAQNHPDSSYIVKPLTMGGGKGISVVDGEKGLSKIRFKTQLVQNYLGAPHLIHGHKWDLRTYVLVTSTVPMRAYVYSRGLVRFASSAYDPNAKKGGKKSQFLTNTSINKKFAKENVTDITWSFADLEAYFEGESKGSYEALFKRMQTAISIVFLSAEQEWKRYYATHGDSCTTCFQIMGVDLIVDDQSNPRVIEVNGQPNMKLSHDTSDHYSVTKVSMMKDMVHTIFKEESVAEELVVALEGLDEQTLSALTPPEWAYLLEYVKESKHSGQWQKVYPNEENAKLHSYFLEQQKHNPSRLALHDVLMHLEQALEKISKT